jgi:hypothetical protein
MSAVVLKIVKTAVERFGPFIDMTDRAYMNDEARENCLRSRALAALCVQTLSGCTDEVAGLSVTDGGDDGGIDALYFDQAHDNLVLVTSEYNQSGTKGMAHSKVVTFLEHGAQNVLTDNFANMNAKIRGKEGEIRNALGATRDIHAVIAIATTTTQPLSGEARQTCDRFKERHYSAVPELCRFEYFDQERLYRALVPQAAPVSFQIRLQDWGEVQGPPLRAYFGRVPITDVAGWWTRYKSDLYLKNIRALQSDSKVNDAIAATVHDEPDNFWYFNNGITIVCKRIKRTPQLGKVLPLNCEDLSIVNGAQTVGTIGSILNIEFDTPDPPAWATGWVHVRLIEVGEDMAEIHRRITQANNFQNAVSPRDFVGMDDVQPRLATEFTLSKRRYVYKAGELAPSGDDGCDLTEAAQALACASDKVALAVQVKRGIGQLWNKDKPFYDELFPRNLDSDNVWRSVLVMRAVDGALTTLRNFDDKRATLTCVHLNRVILHLVFQSVKHKGVNYRTHDLKELMHIAGTETKEVFERVIQVLNEKYPNEYLGTLSKNTIKCKDIVDAVMPLHYPADFLPFGR